MSDKRWEPYVWVTWLTGLLSGEAQCWWAAWHRAHVKYEKRPSTFDFRTWNAQHAELVQTRAAELRAEGLTVDVEDQNNCSEWSIEPQARGGSR